MSISRLEHLASQAEKEGTTLAEVISRTMSEQDIVRAQDEIRSEIARGYSKIEEFMEGVEVQSLDKILAMDEDELRGLRGDMLFFVSDEVYAD